MPPLWYYQVNGFDLGPVPHSELHRLSQKGRIAPKTPVRRDGGDWMDAEQALGLDANEPVARRVMPVPWHIALLDRAAPFGIPLGMALLPWGRVPACVGLVILSPFAVASFRLLIDIARVRDADRSHCPSPTPAPPKLTSDGTESDSRHGPVFGSSSP
jgi:GYF domain 2